MNENQRRLAEFAKTADTSTVIAISAFMAVILKRRNDPKINARLEAEAYTKRELLAERDVEQTLADLEVARADALARGKVKVADDFADAAAFIRTHWMKGGVMPGK